MEKRAYNKKNATKGIVDIFLESYGKMQNTKENIDSFKQALILNVSKTNIEPSRVLDELFSVLKSKEQEKTPELFDCIHSAAEIMISHFFVRKPKVSDAIFFPSEESENRLIGFLGKAKSTLHVCVFTITNNRLADQLYRVYMRNADVKVISDDECSKQLGSDILDLANAGIPVRLDDSPKSHMHNKFAVIDKRIVITGSFNWTTAAVDSNQENLCILDNEELALKYIAEFDKLWKKFEKSGVKSNGSIIKRWAKMAID